MERFVANMFGFWEIAPCPVKLYTCTSWRFASIKLQQPMIFKKKASSDPALFLMIRQGYHRLYFMMKIDEFSDTNHDPNTSCKIAAQVTGLQKPANTTQVARKIWILNEQSSSMKMESGAMILHTHGSGTFVKRERICSFQTNMEIALLQTPGKSRGFTYL